MLSFHKYTVYVILLPTGSARCINRYRERLGKRLGYRQCLWSNITWVCANLGLIVHTVCHYCEMVATAAARQQGLKVFGGGLENCKLRKRVQHLGMNTLLSCDSKLLTSWLCLLKSWCIVDIC